MHKLRILFILFVVSFSLDSFACTAEPIEPVAQQDSKQLEISSRYSFTTIDNGGGSFTFVVIDEVDGNIVSASVVMSNTTIASDTVTSGQYWVTIDEIDGAFKFVATLLIDGESFVVIDDVDGT